MNDMNDNDEEPFDDTKSPVLHMHPYKMFVPENDQE